MRGGNFIWLGDGVTMVRSVQEDYDFVNANLREADLREVMVFDGGRRDALADMEESWTVRDGPHIVCFLATRLFEGDSALSRRRFLVQLTTEHVWRIKVKYVRFSRAVLASMVRRTPPWVTDFFTLPMKEYVGAVRWDERILGMERIAEPTLNGVEHVLFRITRDKATEGGIGR